MEQAMTGVALALAARVADAALESVTIASARVELAGRHLGRQVGGAVLWATVLCGVRR